MQLTAKFFEHAEPRRRLRQKESRRGALMGFVRSAILGLGVTLLGAALGAHATTIPVGDATLAADFVALAYQDLLTRAPSPLEQTQFDNFLLGGGDTSAVSAAIDTSSEYRTNLIAQYFQTFLGRAPAFGETVLWVQELNSGFTDEQVIAQFVGSPEFRAAHSIVSNTELVQQLYSTLLSRAPNPFELSGFVAQLDGGATAAAVATEILQSLEYRDDVVISLFGEFLARTPPQSTVQQILAANLPDDKEIDLLVGSTEFLCRADPRDPFCGPVGQPGVPEPATWWLLGAGFAAVTLMRRRMVSVRTQGLD
jgi:hypothetical protein